MDLYHVWMGWSKCDLRIAHNNNFFFSRKWSDDSEEEDTDGYSEGADDLSSGFELPPMPDFRKDQDEQSSGNVTPIPTQGELQEISIEEPGMTLQKNYFEYFEFFQNFKLILKTKMPITQYKFFIKTFGIDVTERVVWTGPLACLSPFSVDSRIRSDKSPNLRSDFLLPLMSRN